MRIARIRREPEITQVDMPDLKVLDPLIKKYKGKKGNMIPLLQGAQSLLGFIPREAFEKLATDTGLSLSDMYGVATFYAHFG